MTDSDFAEWLNRELESREISMRELSRRSGVSAASISLVANRQQFPTGDFCKAIASGLGLRAEEVFQHAGFIPPEPEQTTTLKELDSLFVQLEREDQERAIAIVRALLNRRE